MGDIVNLKRFRKKQQREKAAQQAQQNRARHGRTQAERQRDRDANQKLQTTLDLHRLNEEER